MLAAAGALGDPWILGQRVVYLGEAGRWDEAHSLANAACGGGEGDDGEGGGGGDGGERSRWLGRGNEGDTPLQMP